MSARTEDEIFQSFKVEHPDDGLRFGEWWRRSWFDQIGDCFERGWWLFPCGKFSKRPLAGFQWSKKALTFEEAVWHAAKGENMAVVAGPSNLIILDMDSDSQRPMDANTLTMKTPRGYQYFTAPPYDERLGAKLRAAGFDTPRAGVMYSLVPLSRTCRNSHGNVDSCLVHDFRYREWVNFGAEPRPFRKVARELLG